MTMLEFYGNPIDTPDGHRWMGHESDRPGCSIHETTQHAEGDCDCDEDERIAENERALDEDFDSWSDR